MLRQVLAYVANLILGSVPSPVRYPGMSLLSQGREQTVKPVRDRLYNSGWAGSITDSEIQDVKDGDYDRETGHKRCAFCRQPKPLEFGDTCDAYCYKNQTGSVPTGQVYAWDKEQKGRGWLTLGT